MFAPRYSWVVVASLMLIPLGCEPDAYYGEKAALRAKDNPLATQLISGNPFDPLPGKAQGTGGTSNPLAPASSASNPFEPASPNGNPMDIDNYGKESEEGAIGLMNRSNYLCICNVCGADNPFAKENYYVCAGDPFEAANWAPTYCTLWSYGPTAYCCACVCYPGIACF